MNFSTHRNRPAWREYNTRRFQNKMESLNLQEHQSELRLKAAQMTREQKIKNLNDRLQSQDMAIELMRQRHKNQTRDLRDLQSRRYSSNLDNGRNGQLYRTNGTCPIDDLRQFTKVMDQRYEKLKDSKIDRSYRLSSEQPLSSHVSYKSVKEMLNHLPITPIFKETTCSLMGISKNSDQPKADISRHTKDAKCGFFAHRIGCNNKSPFHNSSLDSGDIRDQRDVEVPMKDLLNGGSNDKLKRGSILQKTANVNDLKTSHSHTSLKSFDNNNFNKSADKFNLKKSVTFKREMNDTSTTAQEGTDEISLYSRKAMIFSK